MDSQVGAYPARIELIHRKDPLVTKTLNCLSQWRVLEYVVVFMDFPRMYMISLGDGVGREVVDCGEAERIIKA